MGRNANQYCKQKIDKHTIHQLRQTLYNSKVKYIFDLFNNEEIFLDDGDFINTYEYSYNNLDTAICEKVARHIANLINVTEDSFIYVCGLAFRISELKNKSNNYNFKDKK